MDFEQRCELLTELGCKFTTDYEYRTENGKRDCHNVNVFMNVLLPFTPQEWCELCMRDGSQYMGGCCGNMSVLQDLINGIFRNDGTVSCHDLEEIANCAMNHDPISDVPFDKLPVSLKEYASRMKSDWQNYSLWDKLACIWHLVKDCYDAKVPEAPQAGSELDKAIIILSNGLSYIRTDRLFKTDRLFEGYENQRKASQAVVMTIDEVAPGGGERR